MDEDELRVCAAHIGEHFLRAEVERSGVKARCHYCGGEDEPTIPVDELADQIEGAFDRHYQRTSDQPDDFESAMLRDSELSYEWFRHGEPVVYAIAEAAEIDDKIAQDVQAILAKRFSDFEADQMGEETEFADDSHYEWKGPDPAGLQYEWDAFEQSLRTESRYFNAGGTALLTSLFSDIAQHQTHDDKPVVVEAGPDKTTRSVFRARVFDNDTDLEEALKYPARELGPPPFRKAHAGRMNAHGISVFYGSLDPSVALAEVRPPVGSRVVIAKFDLLRPVRLLDLEALRQVLVTGSIFDPGFSRKLELAKFLESLSARMTHPVMPSDEPYEYIVTQAIADYLAAEAEPSIDGILFPSVQLGENQMNLVLFHKSCAVSPDDVPDGTEFMVSLSDSTEDGNFPSYRVWEETPPEPQTKPEPSGMVWDDLSFGYVLDPSKDFREATLKIDATSVEIHEVKAVQFTTEKFPVRRRRSVKPSGPSPF
jgi:hypothetical protein